MGRWILKDRTYKFALANLKLILAIQERKHEYILSRQLLKSSSSIGAMVREAEFSESRADYIHKISIALKEANEAAYWIDLLKDSDLATPGEADPLKLECLQIVSILVATLKTAKGKRREGLN